MRKLIYLGFLLFFLLPFLSCRKKGCTDEKAINYNITANSNDGSCEYCEAITADRGAHAAYIVDQNSSSQFYGQQILRVDVVLHEDTYNDLSCGSGSNGCMANLTFTNLVSMNMKNIDFYVQVDPTSGWSWYYDYASNLGASISSGSSVVHENYSVNTSVCSALDGALSSHYLYSVTYF